VTVHTVEVHLSRVYAKLGVRSRTQLAGRLGRWPPKCEGFRYFALRS
jgi:DNA-binding CsgD family transcriptional regulator